MRKALKQIRGAGKEAKINPTLSTLLPKKKDQRRYWKRKTFHLALDIWELLPLILNFYMFYSFELHFLNSFVKAHESWNVYVSQKPPHRPEPCSSNSLLTHWDIFFFQALSEHCPSAFPLFWHTLFSVCSHWSPSCRVPLTDFSTFASMM